MWDEICQCCYVGSDLYYQWCGQLGVGFCEQEDCVVGVDYYVLDCIDDLYCRFVQVGVGLYDVVGDVFGEIVLEKVQVLVDYVVMVLLVDVFGQFWYDGLVYQQVVQC